MTLRALILVCMLPVLATLAGGYAIALWPQTKGPADTGTDDAVQASVLVPEDLRKERTAQSETALKALETRLLFTEGRVPRTIAEAETAQTAQVPAGPMPDFILKGTMVSEERKLALIADPNQPEVVKADIGESLTGGWTLVQIAPGKATLRNGGRIAELTLSPKDIESLSQTAGNDAVAAATQKISEQPPESKSPVFNYDDLD